MSNINTVGDLLEVLKSINFTTKISELKLILNSGFVLEVNKVTKKNENSNFINERIS